MHSALSLWRRFRVVAELVGLGRALALTPGWLVYRQFLVYERDLRAPLPAPPGPAGLSFQPLTSGDPGRLVAVNPDLEPREVERRLREGERCLVGWLDDGPVYYNWGVTIGPHFLTYIGLPLELQPGDILSSDTFTQPTSRGRGIALAGMLAYWVWAREQGYRRNLNFVAVWNAPSRRVSEKLGRRMVARVYCWQLGPWRRFVVRGAARIRGGALTLLPDGGLPDLDG